MAWSFRLLQIGDTALRVHVTFLLLLFWIALTRSSAGIEAVLLGVVFVVAVFTCVVLHELGHVVAAQLYGIRTPEITVLPIGGIARLERMPQKPGQELVVAIAGPLVNVVIAAVLIGLIGARFDLSSAADIHRAQASIQGQLALVNVMLVVFNLIPAFPLDGGRIFRALLAFFLRRDRATTVAARVGQAAAVVFALVGLFTNPFLVLIAVFMFFAAEAEAAHETAQADTSGLRARDAMAAPVPTLGPDATAADAAALLTRSAQQAFPVIGADGMWLGFITRRRLVSAMGETGPTTPVVAFIETEAPLVAPDTGLGQVLTEIYASPARAAVVLDRNGHFLGYVSAEDAHELLMHATARRSGS
ncbi:MAG: site-2 protease family protein [Pseudomonadota bacterium]